MTEIEEKLKQTGNIVSAINEEVEGFSQGCDMLAARFNTCDTYNSLKYKHYVQSFSPEDNDKMSQEEFHRLGLEVAQTFWADFPVLIATCLELKVKKTNTYRWCNHFIAYNCNVKNGERLKTTNFDEEVKLREFINTQAEANGLTPARKYNWKNDRIKTPSKAKIREAQKEELRKAIMDACSKCRDCRDFDSYLFGQHHIRVKWTREAVSFLHPDRRDEKSPWIRGVDLGEEYTRRVIMKKLYDNADRIPVCSNNEIDLEMLRERLRQLRSIRDQEDQKNATDPAPNI